MFLKYFTETGQLCNEEVTTLSSTCHAALREARLSPLASLADGRQPVSHTPALPCNWTGYIKINHTGYSADSDFLCY